MHLALPDVDRFPCNSGIYMFKCLLNDLFYVLSDVDDSKRCAELGNR